MNARLATSSQRPGLQAARESVELSLPDIVDRLRDMVGLKLVAYVGNVKNTRPVAAWAAGNSSPGSMDEARLRLAFQAARLLRDRYGIETIQSWFMGSNPALGYEAPARFIRMNDPIESGKDLMAAASSFALVG